MKKKQKFMAPVYGLKNGLKQNIWLDKHILLRNIDLLSGEYKLFKEHKLRGSYDVVLEIDYHYDPDDPNEPYPGISINVINKIDAALLIFGDGDVGVAAILPVSKITGIAGITLSSASPRYEECLNKEIDEDFALYYKKYSKAYTMRPLAFDGYRRSRDRFANNDKSIDSCTVLESIFVPKGERSKKSFILNGIKIMGFDMNDINRIDDLVEYRNAIIHADMEKQKKLLMGSKYTHAWFEDTFQLVRKILYNYVETPWN